jgi:8-oxo-dGTP pyrophosphatase MutT (NUDIX family)
MKDIVCSGALIYALDTKRFLFLHRTNGKHKETWGLVGGTNEEGETPWIALQREITEEIGPINISKTVPLESFISNDSKFYFHTYLCFVNEEFLPKLNSEHDGYAWTTFGKWPKGLHYGLRNTLQNKSNQSKIKTVVEVLEVLNEL